MNNNDDDDILLSNSSYNIKMLMTMNKRIKYNKITSINNENKYINIYIYIYIYTNQLIHK